MSRLARLDATDPARRNASPAVGPMTDGPGNPAPVDPALPGGTARR